jgi:hypothetical protein
MSWEFTIEVIESRRRSLHLNLIILFVNLMELLLQELSIILSISLRLSLHSCRICDLFIFDVYKRKNCNITSRLIIVKEMNEELWIAIFLEITHSFCGWADAFISYDAFIEDWYPKFIIWGKNWNMQILIPYWLCVPFHIRFTFVLYFSIFNYNIRIHFAKEFKIPQAFPLY